MNKILSTHALRNNPNLIEDDMQTMSNVSDNNFNELIGRKVVSQINQDAVAKQCFSVLRREGPLFIQSNNTPGTIMAGAFNKAGFIDKYASPGNGPVGLISGYKP